VKCSSCCANALHHQRYFVNGAKEVLELAKLVLIVLSEKVILVNIRLLMTLVER
jgi:hypothetical protein